MKREEKLFKWLIGGAIFCGVGIVACIGQLSTSINSIQNNEHPKGAVNIADVDWSKIKPEDAIVEVATVETKQIEEADKDWEEFKAGVKEVWSGVKETAKEVKDSVKQANIDRKKYKKYDGAVEVFVGDDNMVYIKNISGKKMTGFSLDYDDISLSGYSSKSTVCMKSVEPEQTVATDIEFNSDYTLTGFTANYVEETENGITFRTENYH